MVQIWQIRDPIVTRTCRETLRTCRETPDLQIQSFNNMEIDL